MPLDPKTFPRPPLLEKISKHLLVKWPASMGGGVIAETRKGYWVLETFHPPTYYFPPSDIQAPLTKTNRQTYCEWKGNATYFELPVPNSTNKISNRAWTYQSPTKTFVDLKDHVCFYASEVPWECFVDGEQVEPQPGDFYGSWMTSDIVRESVKGAPGTRWW